MRATEELAKRQRENPLGPAGDRVVRLFAGLPKLVDPELEQVRVSKNLAVGEVNNRQPNAKTFHYPDQSHLIVLFSGLLDFYTSVCDILARSMTYHSRQGVIEGCTQEECIAELEALFLQWTPEGLKEPVADSAKVPLPTEKQEVANYLLQGALTFVLSHELGHVRYYEPRTEQAGKLTRAQEFASDVTGVKTAISAAPDQGFGRVNFAGAVLSLRVLDVFGRLGHTFAGDHPVPLERLDNVFATVKSWCATPADYWWMSPIAFAFDEQLETAGQRASGGATVLPVRPDRTFSRLSAVLEEATKDPDQKSLIIPMLSPELELATDEQLTQIAAFAAEMFAEGAPAAQKLGLRWATKSALFRSIYHEWPSRVSGAFDEAFRSMSKQQEGA